MKRLAYIIIGIVILLVAASFAATVGQETDSISFNANYIISDSDLPLMKKKALDGDAESAFQIYLHYSLGKFDSICAFGWLQIAANQGHAKAQYNLGSTYMEVALFKNMELAKFWLKKAEKNGEKWATERLVELEEIELNQKEKK